MNEKQIKINIFGKVAGKFIHQFQLAILVILLIVTVGIVGLWSLPKESLPEIVFPSLTIQTAYPGADPEDVELLVTEKIENKVKDFSEINTIESETQFGLSSITMQFNEGVDINLKKLEVDNALKELTFPQGVLPPRSFIFTTSEIPLMNISITGQYSQADLTTIGQSLASDLEGIAGVDRVTLSGGVDRQIQVIPKELAMMKYKISFNDLRNILSTQNYTTPIGELDLNGLRYNLRIDERFQTIEDIENTLITPDLPLKAVADVYDGLAPIQSYSRTYTQETERVVPAVFLNVTRKVGSDVVGTSELVRSYLNTKKTQYPNDVDFVISNALEASVTADLDKIQSSAWSGLIVVIIVLFLFIGIKESLIVAITIPLSLLGTLGLLNLFGITFNTFAILGLIVALGLLVDNSIIVMENIDRLRKKDFTSFEAAYYGTNQVGYPIASSTLTTLAAFFPLAILPGILGAFVSTIPMTIMITISVSLFVSIVITPSLAARLLDKNIHLRLSRKWGVLLSTVVVAVLSGYAFYDPDHMVLMYVMMTLFSAMMLMKGLFLRDNQLAQSKITKLYTRLLAKTTKTKKMAGLVLVLGLMTLMASFIAFPSGLLKIAFFPDAEPSALTINIDTPGGMTLEATDQVVKEVEESLFNIEGIKLFTTTIGGREIDSGSIAIEIDTEWVNGFDVLNAINDQLKTIPGAQFTIDRVTAGPPVGPPIEILIQGDDLAKNEQMAIALVNTLKSITGVYNVKSTATQGVPQVVIDLDKSLALQYGVTAAQIGNQLRGEISGVKVTSFRSNQDTVDIVIQRDKDVISNIEEVENLFVATPFSNMLTLSSISDLKEDSGLNNISHKDGKRLVTITGELQTATNVNDVIDQVRTAYPQANLPSGITIQYEGDVSGIEQNFGNLLQSMILAVFLVFLILTIQFNSIKQPFIILTTIPMALIGVIWGLVATQNAFGFYAFMGLVALVGIAANDAIVLIDYINYLKDQGQSTKAAIIEAGQTRLSPVLATTLTTISGVLPLAFKEAYYAQFSFALIFGLLMTTLLTLIFIPTIYYLFTKRGSVNNS